MHTDVAILILAAGSSSRLGRPKQLVMYEGKRLLRRCVEEALCLSPHVFVVLGHEYEACLSLLEDLHVKTLYHEKHAQGMGSSLSFGIAKMASFSHTLVMLCDQPFIPLSHYEALLEFTCKEVIVASLYPSDGKRGVPALFPRRSYEALGKLEGERGAQALLKAENVLHVKLTKRHAIDIDTAEDVETYLRG